MREYEYTLTIDHNTGKYVGEVPEPGIKEDGDNPNEVNLSIMTAISRRVERQIVWNEPPVDGYIQIREYDRDNYENWNIPERGNTNVYFAFTIPTIEWDEWLVKNESELRKLDKRIFYSFSDTPYVMYMAHFQDEDELQQFKTDTQYKISLSDWQAITPSQYYYPYRMALWRDRLLTSLRFTSQTGETKDDKYYFVSEQVRAILKERKPGETLDALCDRLCHHPELSSIDPFNLFMSQYLRSINFSKSTSDTSEKSCIEINTEKRIRKVRKAISERFDIED